MHNQNQTIGMSNNQIVGTKSREPAESGTIGILSKPKKKKVMTANQEALICDRFDCDAKRQPEPYWPGLQPEDHLSDDRNDNKQQQDSNAEREP